MIEKLTLKDYENRHNNKFPNSPIKVIKKINRYIYCETPYGICKRHSSTIGKSNYSITSAIDKISFINLLFLNLYGDKYTFLIDHYVNNKQIIKMECKIHGVSYNTIGHILSGNAGCKTCANILNNPNKRSNNNNFIQKAQLIHGNKYDYSQINYKGSNILVEIICRKHGVFKQSPNNHLKPSNCPTCNNEIKHLNGCGWSLKKWEHNGNKSKYFDSFKVYIIKCWNNDEKFYKIGKTFTTVEKRFKNNSIPYNFKILKEIEGTAKYIHYLENKLKKENGEHKYLPKIHFGGKYECFSKLNK